MLDLRCKVGVGTVLAPEGSFGGNTNIPKVIDAIIMQETQAFIAKVACILTIMHTNIK